MADDPREVMRRLGQDGAAYAQAAFSKALRNIEGLAKVMCPVGHYGRARGKPGRAGGDLRASLRVEFVGKQGNELVARCTSSLPYAARQHDEPFHHPGLYTGAAGDKYAAKFFDRAAVMIMHAQPDPLNKYKGPKRATFAEMLEREVKG